VQSFYGIAAQASEAMGNYTVAISVTLFRLSLAKDPQARAPLFDSLRGYLQKIDSSEKVTQMLAQTQDKEVEGVLRARLAELGGSDRTPSAEESGATATAAPVNPQSANLTLGLDYVFPSLSYQLALNGGFALGVTSLWVNYPLDANVSLKGFAGMLTLNYYEEGRFRGLWFQGGLGLYSLSMAADGLSAKVMSPAVLATIGWRWYWPGGTNVGFGAGFNYLMKHQVPELNRSFSGALPALIVDFGFGL
jgi:hypothetical protein